MIKLYEFLYKLLQSNVKRRIGASRFLKPLRDFFFKRGGKYKETYVEIDKDYLTYSTRFRYYASIKCALKAKNKGVENTLIKHSILLLKQLGKINDNCVIIDVGSNFGYMSMVWGLTVCKKGKVHSFEANRDVHASFMRSIKHNKFLNIVANYNAVGNYNELVKMYHMDTTSNLHNINNSGKFVMVEMLTLDTYNNIYQLERCDLIKIDVDGIEYEILQGCLNVLKIYQPIFIVETNDDSRIIEFFRTNNYDVLDMKLMPYNTGIQLPSNIFCIPKYASCHLAF